MSVIKEKTKKKPIGKKKILLKLLFSALSGVVFAACAAGVFVYLEKHLSQYLEEEKEQVIILGTGNTSQNDNEEETDTDDTAGEDKDFDDAGANLMDMQEWQYRLYAIGAKTKESMVAIGENGESCGVIVAIQDNQIIILAIDCEDVDLSQVKFQDGSIVEGKVLGYDSVLDMAVLSVDANDLRPLIKERLTVVQISNSENIRLGQYVIAVGRPLGDFGSISTGIIRKNEDMMADVDRGCDLFTTDITGDKKGSGFIINQQGVLIGIIKENNKETLGLSAFEVNDVVKIIERMANKKPLPYIGVLGTTVTEEMNAEYGLPYGVYVEQVISESPAILGNICAGDVITGIGSNKIATVKDLQQVIMQTEPGQKIQITVQRQVNGEMSEITYFLVVGRLDIETVKR